ncbi:MAG: transcriptional regulator [Spirochaetia bacterium]|nr:transcriptional regulator [Spirochaetia bacterium]
MSSFNMIIGIVPRGSAELLTHAAAEAGAGGGTISRGKGTAANSILQLLGFADSDKDLVYVLTPSENTKKIMTAMIDVSSEKKQPFGILFTLSVNSFIRTGEILGAGKEDNMSNTTHQLITVIVNKGFADDAMAAARKAGAGGGTIMNARGTAKEGDATFFGMEIVPEKDMILILAENAKVQPILDAIRELPCLAKPGSGIAYVSPAENFTLLGKRK